ncbi:FtsX-like permease family protein [Conexibacter sp. JD483]|uniref:FtsX-like permease family protein n=1 Tax=unclassified Conexibacter TaxID=2627773 RepID=UPI00272296C6|nr:MULTISPECIES: FtsX-like permease family protein [unclassified Conexibacter]MDO8185801.1 ABC transporter permease [Conexibacter sp. CPCC 205706]MDO8198545.1 ABC transporter permease [Conexibacter sp. CPCC 205762]MDR9367631.1 FtsX-like permease family protein [Conexibacter sp. JD483]
MSLRNLWWFYRERLRARRVQELFALVGIAVGVALLFAVQTANQSLSASASQLTEGLTGSAQLQLKARDPRGFPGTLLREVEAIDGVDAAAPVLEFPANAVNGQREQSVTVLAADPRLARMGGRLVRDYTDDRFSDLEAVVLPSGVAQSLDVGFGGWVTLQAAGRAERVPVATVAGQELLGAVAESPLLITSLPYAQKITGLRGRVTRIYVTADPSRISEVTGALEKIAGDQIDVRGADFDAAVFANLAMPNDNSTSLFAGISALVGFLFAFNAMLVMARERRRTIAEMRLAGYRSRTVVQVMLFDAVVLGTAASVLGVVLGAALSRFAFQPDPGYLAIAFPVGAGRVIEPLTVALAFGCGLLAAVAAAMVPLIGAYRSVGPMDAIRDDALDRGGRNAQRSFWAPAAGAAVCLAATTAVLVLAPEAALAGMATLIAAMLLILRPALGIVVASLNQIRSRVRSVVPTIAVGELMSASTRSLAIVAIAAIAVFGTTAIEGARGDLQRGLDPNARELADTTDLWVSARGASNLLATTPFDAEGVARRVESAPGVSSVSLYRGSFLDTGDRRMLVIAPPRDSRTPIPPTQLLHGDLAQATARVRAGGWAVASEAIVREQGWKLGEPFRLESPHPLTLRLAGISTNFGWSPGALVINADDYRAGWGSDAVSAVQVALAPSAAAAVAQRAVVMALGDSAPFQVQTAAQREQSFRTTTRAGLARLQQIAALLIGAAALAVAAATAAMIWQRRRQLADHKLSNGISAKSLWKALLLECTVLLGVGATVGAAFGLYGQQLLDRALGTVTGFPVEHTIGIPAALASLVLVTVITLLIAAVPGWLAARVPAAAAFDQ